MGRHRRTPADHERIGSTSMAERVRSKGGQLAAGRCPAGRRPPNACGKAAVFLLCEFMFGRVLIFFRGFEHVWGNSRKYSQKKCGRTHRNLRGHLRGSIHRSIRGSIHKTFAKYSRSIRKVFAEVFMEVFVEIFAEVFAEVFVRVPAEKHSTTYVTFPVFFLCACDLGNH